MDREGEETGILAKRCLGCKGKGGLLRGDFMAGFDPSARTATLTLEQEAPARFPLRDGRGRPWWESYFGSDYSLLYPEKDHASGEQEAPRIAAALALAPGARGLDLGCGNGRHALALARRAGAARQGPRRRPTAPAARPPPPRRPPPAPARARPRAGPPAHGRSPGPFSRSRAGSSGGDSGPVSRWASPSWSLRVRPTRRA